MFMYGNLPYICIQHIFMGATKSNAKYTVRKSRSPKTASEARFDARLTRSQKSIFEEAARIKGYKSLSEFVIQTTLEAATNIIEKHNAILSTAQDQKVFFEALANPPKPNKALLQAAKSHKTAVAAK